MLDNLLFFYYNRSMKKRLIVALTTFLFIISGFIISRTFLASRFHGVIDVLGLFFGILNVFYLTFGIPRLATTFIYGLFAVPSFILMPQKYHLIVIFIYTIIIVLNPLASLEQYLKRILDETRSKQFDYTPPGRYFTYFKYRKEMKNHYHLPQVQKVYTRPTYRLARTIGVIVLFALVIFLLLFSSSDIIIYEGLDYRSFITLYLSALLTGAMLVLFKKGFNSMFRVFRVGAFPPLLLIIYMIDMNDIVKIVSLLALTLGMLGIIISEIIMAFSRVIYSSYRYTDPVSNEKVWANALYEPFIYNTNKKENIKFEFNLPESLFFKHFKTLLININYYKTIITAITIEKDNVSLYVEFYKLKSIEKIEKAIKKIYNIELIERTVVDNNYYEIKFLHNHEYIIARALNLAHLLIELEIKEPVIVSVTMHFKNKQKAQGFMRSHHSIILEETEDYCLIDGKVKVENRDFMIETELRSLLLDMLVNSGTFVRVMVYY